MIELVKKIISKEKEKQILEENLWKGSIFEEINDLKIDRSGRVGENILSSFLENDDEIEIIYDGDANTNTEDGTYDMKIGIRKRKLKRGETKLARIGKNKSFQHEHLKNTDECDLYIMFDFEPNCFYITVMPKDIDFDEYCGKKGKKHPIFEKSFTKRKGEVNYKFDLSLQSIKNGIQKGFTLKVDETNDNDDAIKNFIKKFL